MVRLIGRSTLALLLIFCSNLPALWAGEEARPKPGAPSVEPSRRLEETLQRWEQWCSGIQSVEGALTVYTYDDVFYRESRANAEFYFEKSGQNRNPGSYAYRQQGTPTTPSDKSRKQRQKSAQFYELLPGQDLWIVYRDLQLLLINTSQKTFDQCDLPLEWKVAGVTLSQFGRPESAGLLDLAFSFQVQAVQERFEISEVPGPASQNSVWVTFRPRGNDDSLGSSILWLINHETGQPQAVRVTDTAGTRQIAYVLTSGTLRINSVRSRYFSNDPFHPDLRGFARDTDVMSQDRPPAPALPE